MKNKSELLAFIAEGNSPTYLHFWGHKQKSKGTIDKSCLSQWHPANFQINNQHYDDAEQYMMAEKARLFDDDEALDKILNANHPAVSKQFGGQVQGFDEVTWREHRVDIVIAGNVAKFQQNPEMKTFLMFGTDQRILVEASPIDKVWGVGLQAYNIDILNPEKWKGENLLGFALMQVRDQMVKWSDK